ncbi:MSCRAMM family protein [Streptomyces bohaiensis]|uniref:MSCRAMM family protein n=1 Tax=Streptomyces bohaiensis TaxID=1431344 RepID=UPI003B7E88C4
MSVDTDRPGPGPRTSGARVRPAALPGGATVTCTVAAPRPAMRGGARPSGAEHRAWRTALGARRSPVRHRRGTGASAWWRAAGALAAAAAVLPLAADAPVLPLGHRAAVALPWRDVVTVFLPALAPPAAVALLGLLIAALLKESPVSDPTPVPPARNGEATYTTGPALLGSVRTPGGAAVPHAVLTLVDAAGRQCGRADSGDDGRFSLTGPGPGGYMLIAAATGLQPRAVGLTLADRTPELDLLLGGPGRLAGRVRTPDGEPVADAVVTLTDARGDVVATTRSAPDGGYRLDGLVTGDYTLAAGAPGRRPGAAPVTVAGGEQADHDIELTGGAVLRGAVSNDAGRPVPDARVTLTDSLGDVAATTVTGSDGCFVFADLAPGEYTVVAAGYPPAATGLRLAGGEQGERDLRLSHEPGAGAG